MKAIVIILMSVMLSLITKAETITLSSDNTLVLNSAVDSVSVGELMNEAKKMDSSLKSGYPIYLFLYTPGGSIQDGLELIEFLTALNRPIHTVTLFAASMGWQIVQHLGKRYVLNYGVLMSHYARGGSSGSIGGSQMPSTKKSLDQLWERRIDLMDQQTIARTNGKQTISSYRKDYMFDLWLNGSEAVNQGYADTVVKVRCDTSLSGTVEKEEDFGFVRVQLTFSKCPSNQNPLLAKASILTNRGFVRLEDFLNQNGRFGKKPAEMYDNLFEISESAKPVLWATDPDMTLQTIYQILNERKAYYSRNLKDSIIYSY